ALRFTQAQICFAAFLLVILTLQGSRLTAILRNPLMRLSGALSYCIYLIHFAVGDGYQFLSKYYGWDPSVTFGDVGSIVVRGIFIIAVSFGIAMLSRKYLEEPFLQLKSSFLQAPTVLAERPFDKVVCTAMEIPPNQDPA